jgi:hypothetical protein
MIIKNSRHSTIYYFKGILSASNVRGNSLGTEITLCGSAMFGRFCYFIKHSNYKTN